MIKITLDTPSTEKALQSSLPERLVSAAALEAPEGLVIGIIEDPEANHLDPLRSKILFFSHT